MLVTACGGSDSAEDLGGAVLALLVGDAAGREALLKGVAETVREVKAIYPRLPVDEERAVAFAAEFLGDASEFSGSILDYLFKGITHPRFDPVAADVNADGQVSLSDCIYLLNWCFRGGPAPLPMP